MRLTVLFAALAFYLFLSPTHLSQAAAPVVPGTGEKLEKVGDDFEDPEWEFIDRFPKSSHEEDENRRYPLGGSTNGRWGESPKRGQPDQLEIVKTPEGGLPGSEHALLIRTVHSGIPGRPSGKQKQDDLFLRIRGPMKGYIPVSWTPSVVVRVYIPAVEHWEKRNHASFGFRLAVEGSDGKKTQEYWPGMFINLQSRYGGYRQDRIHLIVRGDNNGNDFNGPELQPGWVTLGMTLTSDGQVHYYARQGVEDLTAADHFASHFPYHSKAFRLNDSFFNVVSLDDGRSWSTPWIIDDPAVYYNRPGQPLVQHPRPQQQVSVPAPPRDVNEEITDEIDIVPPVTGNTPQTTTLPSFTQSRSRQSAGRQPAGHQPAAESGSNAAGVSEWIR